MQTVKSVDKAVAALGGPAEVARLAGVTFPAVTYWLQTNRFPANSYLLLREHLRRVGLQAPDELWGLKKAPK